MSKCGLTFEFPAKTELKLASGHWIGTHLLCLVSLAAGGRLTRKSKLRWDVHFWGYLAQLGRFLVSGCLYTPESFMRGTIEFHAWDDWISCADWISCVGRLNLRMETQCEQTDKTPFVALCFVIVNHTDAFIWPPKLRFVLLTLFWSLQ